MKVKDLKKLLENAPDDMPVMVLTPEHSYRETHCQMTTGLMMNGNQWTEDYGEGTTPEAKYGNRLPILLVGG